MCPRGSGQQRGLPWKRKKLTPFPQLDASAVSGQGGDEASGRALVIRPAALLAVSDMGPREGLARGSAGSKGATGPYVWLWGWTLGPHLAEQGVGCAVCPLASGGHEPSFVGCQRALERHCLAAHAMRIGKLPTSPASTPYLQSGARTIHGIGENQKSGPLPAPPTPSGLCIWWSGLWPAPLRRRGPRGGINPPWHVPAVLATHGGALAALAALGIPTKGFQVSEAQLCLRAQPHTGRPSLFSAKTFSAWSKCQ